MTITIISIRRSTGLSNMKLNKKIKKAENQIKEGKFVKADFSMSDEEIDDLLMS